MKKRLMKVLTIGIICILICGLLPKLGIRAADTGLSEKKKTIMVGESFTLTLKNASGKVTWKSSDKKVATVKKGVVTAVSEGKAKITAKNNGKKYTCKITVKKAKNADVKVSGIEIMKTGIAADWVILTGNYASAVKNSDDWNKCEAYLVNAEGKTIVHQVYSETVDGGLSSEFGYSDPGYTVMESGLILCDGVGYFKENGKKVFKLDWQDNANYILKTTEYDDGVAVVVLGEKVDDETYYYLINEKGKVVVKIQVNKNENSTHTCEWLGDPNEGMTAYHHEESRIYTNETTVTSQYIEQLIGYYDNKGKLLEVKDGNGEHYSYGWDFSGGLAAVKDSKTGLIGFINKKGKLIIPCDYTGFWGDGCTDGYILVSMDVNGEEKTGVIDKNGKVIIPFEYDDRGYGQVQAYGLFRMFKDGKAGALNNKGKVVIPFKYNGLEVLNDDYVIAINEAEKYGVIDRKNNTVINFDYEDMWWASEKYNLFAVCKDGKYGCISINGEIIVPFEYDDISSVSDDGVAYAIKNGQLYVVKLKLK